MTDAGAKMPGMLLVVVNAVGWTALTIIGTAGVFALDMEYMGGLFQLMYLTLLAAAAVIAALSILCVPIFAARRLKEVVANLG